ncbi:YbaN family protein [Shinella zoogloeoides]|uniref:YbaN family protein n=1 Tax=Shinella zoogloeoides TaxID=352475 RepID=UPI001F55EB67|nr:YbaN family protein [Shinella zoogloeoides]
MRSIYMLAGFLMTALGIIGVFLPLLPTTPFLLVAAWCFSRSSPRFEQWLLDHRTLGPPLANWRREGAISARAKIAAVGLIALSYALLLYRLQPSPALAISVGLVLACSIAFIVTRPLPRKD